MFEMARKLRGRSLHELGVRGVQAISAAGERRGWSAQSRLLDDVVFLRKAFLDRAGTDAQVLLDRFRSRAATASFFPAFEDREGTLALFRSRWPRAEHDIIARAERVRDGRFDLLGRRDLSFGKPIDWCLDPVTGKRTPLLHWTRIDHLDPETVGEYKVTWELNRHQYFVTLGQAYWFTGNERYAATFVEHLTAWIDANPPTRGINWSSSLEVAFRSISWIWALHFFRDSERLTPALFLRALKFLYLQGKHVERYLSTYFSPNTHLTGEALSLFYVGVVFPEFKSAARWRAKGLSILMGQLDIHVRADGVYFEQSTYYHRYTADFYTHLCILCDRNGIELPDRVPERLRALLDHLMFVARPDGTTPLIGDDDGGRLVCLDRRAPNDFRAVHSTGAVLFSREDYRFAARELAEETLWLLGAEGVRRFETLSPSPPADTSRAFPDGGYFVMRDGWAADSNYLLVDCGPHGTMNCGHAHADALAIELVARGERMLVDPGTFCYTEKPELRDGLRSSLAHTTLVVDGASSSVPSGPFQWSYIAKCSLRRWLAAERFDFFEGSHDGYARLPDPAIHTRFILFIKGRYWIVLDRIAAREEHQLEMSFRLAPEIQLRRMEQGVMAQIGTSGTAGVGLRIMVTGADDVRCDHKPVSESYGKLTEAPVCGFATHGVGGQELIAFLLPASECTDVVRAEAASGGRVFALRYGDWEDRVAIASPAGRIESRLLRSDFEWTWLRRSVGEDAFQEFVAIGGSRLEWNGEEVFRSEARVGYVAARLQDRELWVDTDAAGPFAINARSVRTVRVSGTALPVDCNGWCTVGGIRVGGAPANA
jgi:hypothetical protein